MFLRVRIEHELGNRAMHARQTAFHDGKARAGDFRRHVKVEQLEALTEIDVIFGRKVERARRADFAHFHVIVSRFSCRHRDVRHIRYITQEAIHFFLDFFEFLLERFELVRLRIDFGDQRRGIFLFCFGLPDLLGQLISARLQVLRLHLNRLAACLDAFKGRRIKRQTAVGQSTRHSGQIVAQHL